MDLLHRVYIYTRHLESLAWSSELVLSRNISSVSHAAHEDLERANNAGVCYLSLFPLLSEVHKRI